MEERFAGKNVYVNLLVMTTQNRHLIFSDESGWDNSNRYGSVALVSGTYQNTKDLNFELKTILDTYNKSEVRFKATKNRDSVNVAHEFIKLSFNYLLKSKIKIHVLVWDKQDSRHDVVGRCDIENLKRMYYHNMMVLKRHWNINTTWEFYPDEFTAINWTDDIIYYLENTSLQKSSKHPQLFDVFEQVRFPEYNNTKELVSKNYPIIQLADLYAGLIRTSRSESEKFYTWYYHKKNNEQPVLFDLGTAPSISNSMKPKFELMYMFKKTAESFKMGISLNEKRYFSKKGRKNNLFIWHYEPQGNYDKAPLKK